MTTHQSARPVAVFLCGKMGAGKSTAAMRLAAELDAMTVAEDDWLAQLYPGEINSFDDYLRCAARMKPLVKSLVQAFLRRGVSVVMDFPANTQRQRVWLKAISDECGADHRLIYLEADDRVCLERLGKRRLQQPERAAFDNEAVFHQVTKYFEPPTDAERLAVEIWSQVGVDATPGGNPTI